MPERLDFWGITQPWLPAVVYGLMALASLILVVRFGMLASQWWRVGRPEKRWNRPLLRLWRVIAYYLAQLKVLRQPYPGIMHVLIFWSMLVFFAGTALATLHSHFFGFLYNNVYFFYKLMLDLAVLTFLVGAGMAAYRRFVTKPSRLTYASRFTWTLALLTIIVLLGVLVESLRLAIVQPLWAGWSPVGWAVAQLWIASGASAATLHTWHLTFYITHLLLVAVLIATLPDGTLLHIATSLFTIFFAKLEQPLGALSPVPVNAQGEYLYADRLQRLTWKQLLDGDTCTECGRCQDACPAYAAGEPLSPKQVILSVRDAFHSEKAQVLKGQPESKPLVGGWVTDEVLWACTTCGACVQECPVLIEHLDIIVDMRRFLISEGRVDELLQGALANLGRYGNSFGQSDRARAKWAQTMQPKIKDARKEEVEYLWFVGDYASYNPTANEATRLAAEVFQLAGIDFGILYEAERNAGNDVRRIGEEGLFEVLVEKNSAALARCNFKTIITTDPHSYNALRHDYPADVLNGRPVLHYAELLDQLIASGKLKLSKKLDYKVTFHDPCYLGRYNGVYDAPRRVIEATGCQVVEMERSRSRGFCCNAGGGQIWIKEGEIKERPSENRMREAAALPGVNTFVVACPKDLTMFKDAVKTTSMEDKMAVKDLIDLVHEAI